MGKNQYFVQNIIPHNFFSFAPFALPKDSIVILVGYLQFDQKKRFINNDG